MSQVQACISVTNEGTYERVLLPKGHVVTIDRLTLKMADGKRLRRYAVCLDGCWKSCRDNEISLREARERVEMLKHDFSRPVFKPLTIDEMRQVAREKGAEQAYNLLLLGGYGFIEGTCKDYDDLLKEFERNMQGETKSKW